MRLIDADALLNDTSIVYHTEFGDAVVDVEDIKKAPTLPNPCGKPCAFVRPHGEWKYNPYGYFITYKCTNCGDFGMETWHFCPNCGADMRKEGEEK